MKAIFSALLLGALISLPALSQDAWPTKPLRVVIPYPAGSPDDTIARLIAPSLKQSLNQPILVENRPGAGGNIGAQEVIRSTDEHTVLFGTDTILTINPHIYRKLPFNSAEDLVPVTLLASFSQMLVCNPHVPAKSLPQLVTLADKQDMTYASGGQGVPGHIAMEMLLSTMRMRMTHAPYKGPSPAMQDVLGGTVPCGFLASPVLGPFVKDGKLTGIVVSGVKRISGHPSVPTAEEAGAKGYDATFFEVVAMPKGTPAARIARLQSAIAKALSNPEVRATLATLDLEPIASSKEEAIRRLEADRSKWGAVVGRLKLQVD